MLRYHTLTGGATIIVLVVCANAPASLFRHADFVHDFAPGSDAFTGFTDSEVALGPPSTGHSPGAPENVNDAGNTVVSLGQGGSITLGFHTPVANQPATAQNPWGYDMLVVGNAFQGANAITPEFDLGRFNEPGFVEVARDDGTGQPDTWHLILPRLFATRDGLHDGEKPMDFTPDQLTEPTVNANNTVTASGDVGVSSSLFDGFVDAVPFNGSVFETALNSGRLADLVLDDPSTFEIEGLGGAGIDLDRAVLQSEPGVPLLDTDGQFQFAQISGIDFLRITDARESDSLPELGAVTTEVDGVIVLPQIPEPSTGLLAAAGLLARGTRRRR